MIHMSKKVRLTVIVIAVWTILQTIVHAFWIITSYSLSMCKIKVTSYDDVFLYLTYFYRQSCGPIDLSPKGHLLNSTIVNDDLPSSNQTAAEVLYYFLKATLETGKLPEQSAAYSRTSIYLYLFLYTDITWIVSSVFLFVGAFFEEKRKFMPILFYGPWMLICFFVTFLDVVASVHFGLDIPNIYSYTTWLKFIGVSNYADFQRFNDYPKSQFIFAMPSTLLVCLLARVFFVWLINIICFFIILFMAIPEIFFKEIVRAASRSRHSGGSKLTFNSGEELDLNSSEARIRNWQLFYGAVEANSSKSSESSSSSSNNTDHNYNSKSNEGDTEINTKEFEARYEKNRQLQELSTISLADSGFRRYSDVADGVSAVATVAATNLKLETLRSQLPWSYMSPDGKFVKRNQTYTRNPIQKSVKIRDSVTDSSRL